jgi:hypothetical protein
MYLCRNVSDGFPSLITDHFVPSKLPRKRSTIMNI